MCSSPNQHGFVTLVSNSWLPWDGENRQPELINQDKGLVKKEQWREDNEEV